MTPTGKDYEISFEDIMDGETQSDSSTESGSGNSGIGTSDEVLQALQSLSDKVDKLSEESKESEGSLEKKLNDFSSLLSNVGVGSLSISDTEKTGSKSEIEIKVPDNAKIMILNLDTGSGSEGWEATITVTSIKGGYHFFYNDSHGRKDFVLTVGKGDVVKVTRNTKLTSVAASYCFIIEN